MKYKIKIDVGKEYFDQLYKLVREHPVKWYMKPGVRTMTAGIICLLITFVIPFKWMSIVPAILCFLFAFFGLKPMFIAINNIFLSEWFGGELGEGKAILDEDSWDVEFCRWKLMGDYSEPLFVYYPADECILMRVRNIHFILSKPKLESGDWGQLLSFLSGKMILSENASIYLRLGSIAAGSIYISQTEK